MMTWVCRLLLVAVSAAAPALAFAGERSVRLDVDGEVQEVRTYASSVPEVLDRAGVDPAAVDRVRAPHRLVAGATIEVRRAKPLLLLSDGDVQVVWVHALTVGEALEELGQKPGPEGVVRPALGTPVVDGMPVVVRNAVRVSVRVDGGVREVVSTALTLADMLGEAGIEVGPSDVVVPSAPGRPVDGSTIRVIRVRTEVRTERVRVPFETIERRVATLERGNRRVVQRGVDGSREVRARIRFEDGRRVGSEVLSSKVVAEPRTQIVEIGTASLRHREEGGASWFRASGMVAAHRTLPIGTRVRVTNVGNGSSVWVTINQRGPFVDGRVIDLSDGAFAAVAPLSQGTFRARLEW